MYKIIFIDKCRLQGVNKGEKHIGQDKYQAITKPIMVKKHSKCSATTSLKADLIYAFLNLNAYDGLLNKEV